MQKRLEDAIAALAQVDAGSRAEIVFEQHLKEIIRLKNYVAFDEAKKSFMTNHIARKLSERADEFHIGSSHLAEAEEIMRFEDGEDLSRSVTIAREHDNFRSTANDRFELLLNELKLPHLARPEPYKYTFTSPVMTTEMIEITENKCVEDQSARYLEFVLGRLERIWILTENVADSREEDQDILLEEIGDKCKALCEVVHRAFVPSLVASEGRRQQMSLHELPGNPSIPAACPSLRPALDSKAADDWWRSVTDMQFDHPEQERAQFYSPDSVRARLPVPGVWLTGYRTRDQRIGVSFTGAPNALKHVMALLDEHILALLPEGSVVEATPNDTPFIDCARDLDDFADAVAQRAWVGQTLNIFATVLRAHFKAQK